MINWMKEKYQSHFCHKIWIFTITWVAIYLSLWFALDCVGAIAYTWYYNINFTWLKWLQNLPAIWVITNSAWVSGVVVLGMFLVYWNHHFDNWKPFDKKNKSNSAKRKELKEFKKIGKDNIVHLNNQVGLSKTQLNKHTLLIGATGSGKTTTALSIINQLVYKLNQTAIIIDGKGDIDLINKVKIIDNNAFIWQIGATNQYNPLASKSHIVLADKIMSLFDFTEPHYQAIAHSYIILLIFKGISFNDLLVFTGFLVTAILVAYLVPTTILKWVLTATTILLGCLSLVKNDNETRVYHTFFNALKYCVKLLVNRKVIIKPHYVNTTSNDVIQFNYKKEERFISGIQLQATNLQLLNESPLRWRNKC